MLIDASKTMQAKAKEAGKKFNGLTPAQAEKILEKAHRTWLKERRKEIREQVKEDLAVQRELERDLRKYGGIDHEHEFAGWILRIGERCVESKHLTGLLVTAEDAKADLGLLPPYDTCREETCECDIDPVDVGDVPKGTRIAERVLEQESGPVRVRKKRSKSGCMTVLFLILIVIVVLYVVAT